jgi:hypothetical protein
LNPHAGSEPDQSCRRTGQQGLLFAAVGLRPAVKTRLPILLEPDPANRPWPSWGQFCSLDESSDMGHATRATRVVDSGRACPVGPREWPANRMADCTVRARAVPGCASGREPAPDGESSTSPARAAARGLARRRDETATWRSRGRRCPQVAGEFAEAGGAWAWPRRTVGSAWSGSPREGRFERDEGTGGAGKSGFTGPGSGSTQPGQSPPRPVHGAARLAFSRCTRTAA